MSYTIEDIDKFIGGDSWENEDWSEFRERTENTSEPIKVDGKWPIDPETGKTIYKWRDLPEAEWGIEIPGIGRALYVDSFGGEGQGDDYWFVFSVTDADGTVRYFRRNGWHASFNGGYYDGPTDEVKSVEKVITVWVKA